MNSAEKENVIRILKEEPLLATSVWCRFGWHRWMKFSKYKEDALYYRQERECAYCGKVNFHKKPKHGM